VAVTALFFVLLPGASTPGQSITGKSASPLPAMHDAGLLEHTLPHAMTATVSASPASKLPSTH
jgi:hypothetical protein